MIRICITGSNFSGEFLDSLTATIEFFNKSNIEYKIHRSQGNNSYYVKNNVLKGCFTKGEFQKPFDGEHYDKILWIDSDIVWKPEDVHNLINTDGDVVTGLYVMTGNRNTFTCIEKLDMDYAVKHGHFKYLHRDEITGDVKDVEIGGMGFMKVERGVFESIPYPWFYPEEISPDYGFTTGDVIFFRKAKEMGFSIKVNQSIIVGHQKSIILT